MFKFSRQEYRINMRNLMGSTKTLHKKLPVQREVTDTASCELSIYGCPLMTNKNKME